jgi:hypothetical protein
MVLRTPKKIESINDWIDVAARGLAKDPRARVREETLAHYESAREEGLRQGTSEQEADAAALASLGNARTANRQYKKVHLTERESTLIRCDELLVRAIQARPYLLLIPLLLLCAAVAAVTIQPEQVTVMAVIGMVGISFELCVPFLISINTRPRGYVYRAIRLAWPAVIIALPHVYEGTGDAWLLFVATALPIVWVFGTIEWTRASARRKLPQADWPRSLYF